MSASDEVLPLEVAPASQFFHILTANMAIAHMVRFAGYKNREPLFHQLSHPFPSIRMAYLINQPAFSLRQGIVQISFDELPEELKPGLITEHSNTRLQSFGAQIDAGIRGNFIYHWGVEEEEKIALERGTWLVYGQRGTMGRPIDTQPRVHLYDTHRQMRLLNMIAQFIGP